MKIAECRLPIAELPPSAVSVLDSHDGLSAHHRAERLREIVEAEEKLDELRKQIFTTEDTESTESTEKKMNQESRKA